MSTSQILDQFIAENGGNTRDALNVALARLGNATALLIAAQQQSEFLSTDKESGQEIPWDKFEDWVQYVAMDEDGQWWEFENKPFLTPDYWRSTKPGKGNPVNFIPFTASDWRTSLRQRPNPTVNDKLTDALRQILDIRFAEYPDGDESAPYKIITRMQRIANKALQ
jgi:hypothetical protein